MKKNKSNFKFVKNWATACFFGWLIFSPVPGENSNQPHQPIETIYIRDGTKQYEVGRSVDNLDKKNFFSRKRDYLWKLFEGVKKTKRVSKTESFVKKP